MSTRHRLHAPEQQGISRFGGWNDKSLVSAINKHLKCSVSRLKAQDNRYPLMSQV